MDKLTHFDQDGNAIMVDVSNKANTSRSASAIGYIQVNQAVYDSITSGDNKKGDVLNVARVAGIMASKACANLIPMCHPLLITKCTIDFELDAYKRLIKVISLVKVNGQTGVEMEALTACNIALLTIYDMCKALDKQMVISNIHVNHKSGGKSGEHHFEIDAR